METLASFVQRTRDDLGMSAKGLAMRSNIELSIIEDTYKKQGEKWFCYALLCFKGLNESEQNEFMNFYYKKHIKVIFVDDYDKLITTLNNITNISFKNIVLTKE